MVYAVDVGSIRRGHLGWAGRGVEAHDDAWESGVDLDTLVAAVGVTLDKGTSVALGFECPLFIPVPHEQIRLGGARTNEGNRPWSAGAGASVLASGTAQFAWTLRELGQSRPELGATVSWPRFCAGGANLLLWEAFVTQGGSGGTHIEDAKHAVNAFIGALPDLRAKSAVTTNEPLSIIGASMIWAGLSVDPEGLHAMPIVIRTNK